MKNSGIINELDKYAQRLCSVAAGLIADDLVKETKYSIEQFYNDYDPKYYVRHNPATGLRPYNFLERSYARLYKNSHNKFYTGGVKIGTNLSNPGKPMIGIYQDDLQEVLDTVYHGFHGVSSMFNNPKRFEITPRMSPSPLEIIQKKRDEIERNINKYLDKAKKQIGNTVGGKI